tara:strand:+ start:18979 stop:19272 length:294 start_codon:yes stop_codon:yes gene_type:complete
MPHCLSEAYKASAERCIEDSSTCDPYIRYLPENPQINAMLNASKAFFLNKEKGLAVSEIDHEILEKYCSKQKSFETIPPGLLKTSKALSKSYLDEQK